MPRSPCEQAGEPAPVLDEPGLVDAEIGGERSALRGGQQPGFGAQHRGDRVAGHQPDGEEDEHGHAEQDQRKRQQPLRQIVHGGRTWRGSEAGSSARPDVRRYCSMVTLLRLNSVPVGDRLEARARSSAAPCRCRRSRARSRATARRGASRTSGRSPCAWPRSVSARPCCIRLSSVVVDEVRHLLQVAGLGAVAVVHRVGVRHGRRSAPPPCRNRPSARRRHRR